MVSHHDHHRHSAYLVSHVDAPGFSQSQQRRLGELVLGQRGGLRKIEAGLSRELTAWQVLCLRLAVIECHARGEVDASGLTPEPRRQQWRAPDVLAAMGGRTSTHGVPAARRGGSVGRQGALLLTLN